MLGLTLSNGKNGKYYIMNINGRININITNMFTGKVATEVE